MVPARDHPIVRVGGRSRARRCRLSVTTLTCCKPRQPSRLIYRPSTDARPDGRKSFAWTSYRDLIGPSTGSWAARSC